MAIKDIEKTRAYDRERNERRKLYNKRHREEFKKRNPEYFKKYFETYRDYKKFNEYVNKWKRKYPEKAEAYRKLYQALLRKELIKESCFCGNIKVDGHHPDYSKPIDVIWLCRKHHVELHKKIRTAVL